MWTPQPTAVAAPARAAPARAAARRAAARRAAPMGPGEQTLSNTYDGHGTPVAGVIAQFVPQATIDPIDIFAPNILSVS